MSNVAKGALAPWPRVVELLEREGLEALVASSPENVTYLTEYWGLSHWARRGTQVYGVAWNEPARSVEVVVPAALADLVTEEVAAQSRAHAYGRFVLDADERSLDAHAEALLALAGGTANPAAPLAALTRLLGERLRPGARVAVEWEGFAPGLGPALAEALPALELVPAAGLLARLRAVKGEREIELLRRAASLTERAVAETLAATRPGASESELARRFLGALVEGGALPETTVIGSGERSALPNGQPGERSLRAGDIVRFDVGCRYGRYVSDIARVASLGPAPAEAEHLYAALSAGLERAAAALRPGRSGADLFAEAVAGVREHGLPGYRRTHCGHGIGIANYDLPLIGPGSDDPLEPGMVLCLETPYYRLGAFGLQVEDTFLVTENGAERFTHAPTELPILSLSGG